MSLPCYGDNVVRGLRPRDAVDALAAALGAGLDPAAGPARSFVPLEHGEMLLMPAGAGDFAGVKIVTVAPGNDALGLPRIHGVYALFDSVTLRPVAILDGSELTLLRTPAVSMLAVRDRLRSRTDPLHVVVAGTGPQAVRHVEAARDVTEDVRTIGSMTYLSRRPEAVELPGTVLRLGSAEADAAVAAADLVVCATASATPLFDGALVREDAAVVAVGSHDPDRRELDECLLARSFVVVEDVDTALREAGDVVMAVKAGALDVPALVPLARAVADPAPLRSGRPLVFKSTGMAWQDLVVATAVVDAAAYGRRS